MVGRELGDTMRSFEDKAVEAVFAGYPVNKRRHLLALRELIFETAAEIDAVGALEETLKWGEPAYLTSQSKSGSTIRIGWKRSHPTKYALYFNCQTTLVDTFRTLFDGELEFEGNRAIVFDDDESMPIDATRQCIAAALTYHRARRRSTA